MKKFIALVFSISILGLFFNLTIFSQTSKFTNQGNLPVGSVAEDSYDFEFSLFDSASGGVQIGKTITQSNVPVKTVSIWFSLILATYRTQNVSWKSNTRNQVRHVIKPEQHANKSSLQILSSRWAN